MNAKPLASLLIILLAGTGVEAAEITADPAPESAPPARYLQVSVDNLVIDTEGLIDASQSLAQSIDKLSVSIERLATDSEALSAEDRAALVNAVKSADQASQAVARLADQLPQTAQQLTAQLPQIVSNAREPIAEISRGLESAREGIVTITESLPVATANARELVNSALDAALVKLSIYSVILLAALALVVIAVMWFVYSQYLNPLAQKLDALVGAPEHFDNMSRHMQQTSNNLLALQGASPRRVSHLRAR